MTVVVLGDLMVDVLVRHAEPLARGSDTAARIALSPGGAAGNVAAWLVRAGAPAALVARVGEDPLAEVALRGLAGVDVRVRPTPGAATGTCVVLVGPDAERTMLPDPGANADLRPDDLPEDLFRPGAVLHLSGYALLRPQTRPVAVAALERARAAGMRTSLDPASAAPLAAEAEALAAAGRVDLLVPNADEARVLGPDLHRLAREVVVTAGPGGARWSDGQRTVTVPAVAAGVVDTTGAGDAFAAGLLAGWTAGDPPEAALLRAATLAAEAVARPGGRPATGAGDLGVAQRDHGPGPG